MKTKTSTKTTIPPASLDTSNQLWMKLIPTVSDRIDRVRQQVRTMAAVAAGLTTDHEGDRLYRADVAASIEATAADVVEDLWWLSRLDASTLDALAPTDDQRSALDAVDR